MESDLFDKAEKASNEKSVLDNTAKEQASIDQSTADQKTKNKDDILATGEALIEGAKMLAGKNKALQKVGSFDGHQPRFRGPVVDP